MNEGKFSEYWNQAQFCYFKAEVARGPASKHLWLHLAKDWIALAEPLLPQPDQQTKDRPEEQREPFVAA
jgi:hypothetical protein